MSDRELRPLDPELEELLRAERGGDGAPTGARERVRSRVLLSVGVAAGGAAAVGQASGAHGALLKAAPKLLSLPAKLVLCVAGVTAVGLGVHVARRSAAPHHTLGAASLAGPPAAAPAPPPKLPELAPPAAAAPAEKPAPVEKPAPAAVPAPAEPAPVEAARARPPARKADPDEALPAERALLEQGRAALGRGDSARALSAVERHQRRFPHGQLAEERESLWIRALVAAGEPDSARSRAAEFRARYPRSIFLPVVEATIKPLQ